MTIQWTNEQQRILQRDRNDGCARILAGPGTGKSATIVEWIGRILQEPDPPRVRLLTFTRAATGELAAKVAQHQATEALQPSTIHSFAISILLANPGVGELPTPLRIADGWEERNLIFPSLSRRVGTTATSIKRLFQELAANWESLEEETEDERVNRDVRLKFQGAWQEHRRIYGYTLLAELPWALRRALLNHTDLEGTDFDVLVVDEYQDLNACDLEVIRLIRSRGTSIIGVGDDDQSIYSFRKAAPEGIRRFQTDYPGADDLPLSVTHRCGSTIIEWADHVISQDPDRPADKRPPQPAQGSPQGEAALLAFGGHAAEPKGIAKLAHHLTHDEGLDASEILVLLKSDPNGRFSSPIQHELDALNVP